MDHGQHLLSVEDSMDDTQIKRIIEAVLFAFGAPVALKRLSEVLDEVETLQLRQLIQALNDEYMTTGRSFHVQEVAGGYQLVTHSEFASWIKRALLTHKPDAVSKATMETLAIIAYRQPITKAEIEVVRGVDVTGSIDALLERRFARVAGRKDSPGRPFLYGTTTEFLRHFGLASLDALPPMAQPVLTEPVAEEPRPPVAHSPSTETPPEPPALVESAAAPVSSDGGS